VTAAPDVSALRMLRQARDRIDRDYAEAVGIPALAAAAGYSTTHFIRAFRAAYGETPGAYRTRRRVERACELLRSVNLSVTEICHTVGFTSLGSFSARFSGLMGQSPSAYRGGRPPRRARAHPGMLRPHVAHRLAGPARARPVQARPGGPRGARGLSAGPQFRRSVPALLSPNVVSRQPASTRESP